MDESNVHIRSWKAITHYHGVMTGLVTKYTPQGGSVADIGCGHGHLLSLIHEADPSLSLMGTDAFAECVEATRQRVRRARVVQVREEVLDCELLGDDLDTCIMAHSLEHMLNPVQSVRDLLACLKPKGHLILAVPNPVRPTVFFGNLRRQNYVNRGHVYAWDRAHWINFLEVILGLEVVEYASDEVKLFSYRALRLAQLFRLASSLKKIEIGLSRLAPWWSFSNIAVIRRGE